MSRRTQSGARPLREDLVVQACLEAYGAVRHDGRLADRALEHTLRAKRHLYSTERREVAERVYALLRQQMTVERLLDVAQPGWASRPTSEQDLLRLAASRVLDEESPSDVARGMALADKDAKALARLPEAARALDALPPEERFAVAASLPAHIAERVRRDLGSEAEAFAEASNQRAPLTGRVNTLRTDREELLTRLHKEGADARPTSLSPLGVQLDKRINAFSMPAFREGGFEIQDEGSQLLGMLVDAPPKRVVDACAGAGGKALQLAAQMHNRGELFALDIDERRLDELKKRARRAGAHNVRVQRIPADDGALAELEALRGKADRVLVDAPCSGSGTFRRKPDARYRLKPEDVAAFASRQLALLFRFAPLVAPGGRMIYGTCSVFTEENEDVVKAFVARDTAFTVLPAEQVLGASLGPRVTRGGFLKVAPHSHGTDGFFGAVLQRSR